MTERIWGVSFSPAGGTKLVVEKVTRRLGDRLKLPVSFIDFTSRVSREKRYVFSESDFVIAGTPVYAGRVPNKIMPDWKQCFEGNGAYAAVICTYGNRSYGSAPAEMQSILKENGFFVCGKAAVVCEHVFTNLVGTGRPDDEDWNEILFFADRLAEWIRKNRVRIQVQLDEKTAVGSYYTPLREDGFPANFLKAKPVTDEDFLSHVRMLEKNFSGRSANTIVCL